MRKLLVTILFMCIMLWGKAQQHGAQWLLGYNTSVMDFRYTDSVHLYSLPTTMYMTLTNANICDENGELLYYTNGIFIGGKHGDTLANSEGLSPCPYTTAYTFNGLNIQQGCIFLPKPGDNRYYYLFHTSNDGFNDSRPKTLYYSLIDKEANWGAGAVVQKNVAILRNTILRGGGITACKHANGRDYWLIVEPSVTNKFYKFLVTPDSILGPFIQTIGPQFPLPYDIAYSKFSQDGSKFTTGTIASLILVMDFDRCTGDFYNPITIYNSSTTDPVNYPSSGCASLEFSPNGNLLYVADRTDIIQYNLLGANIQDSIELYNDRQDSDFYQAHMLQVAPNGKMYCSTWNGGAYYLHVINNPDVVGDSCNFIYGGQHTLTTSSVNVPNMINYQLGALAGSSCDTVIAGMPDIYKNETIRVQPVPANKYAYVEMPTQGDYELQMLNETGQLITTRQTRQVDIFDTENLAAGVYFIRAIDKHTGKEIAVRKIAVVH